MRGHRSASERGATLVEYALLVALIGVVSMVAIRALERDSGDRLSSQGTSVGQPSGDSDGALPGASIGTLPSGSNSAPSGSFVKLCTGRDCTFTATATDPDGDPITYAWDFSDNPPGSGQTASHQFPNSTNSYTVSLTLSDNNGNSASVGSATVSCTKPPNPASCS